MTTLNLGTLTRDARRIEAMRQLIAANPGASDEALAELYASDEVYDQHTPPAVRKTHYTHEERVESCLRFILPAAR